MRAITSIDTSAAEKMAGVKAVQIIQKPGTEIFWAGDEIVGVAAVDEPTAEDAVRAIKSAIRSAAAFRLRRGAAEEHRAVEPVPSARMTSSRHGGQPGS